MPKAKGDNVRKVNKKTKRGIPQQATYKNGYRSDSAVSDDSYEVANSLVPSEGEKNVIESDDERPHDFTGEMNKLLGKFSADMNKTMEAKRRKLEQFTQESTRSTAKKLLETNKNQCLERCKLIDHFQNQFNAILEQGEADLEKIKDTEEKLEKLLVQKQKNQQQIRLTHVQRLNALKNLSKEYYKGMNELEENHVEQYSTVNDELRKEIALLQKKFLMETQQQEMMNVRKHLKQLFQ